MISIERININHIPTLNVAQYALRSERLPTVIYYHGFNGEKESSLTIAYKMAEKGLRVILPDAPLHGERAVSEGPVEHGKTFWEIVLQTIDELDLIRQYIQEEKLVQEDKFGLGGTSMGGMVTYAALSKYEWIQTTAILMGTPYLTKRAEHTLQQDGTEQKEILEKVVDLDITEQLHKLNERPIFIWHGEKDEIVPVTDSRQFAEKLTNHYKNKENVQFIEEKERIHNISKLSIEKTAEWFKKQL